MGIFDVLKTFMSEKKMLRERIGKSRKAVRCNNRRTRHLFDIRLIDSDKGLIDARFLTIYQSFLEAKRCKLSYNKIIYNCLYLSYVFS